MGSVGGPGVGRPGVQGQAAGRPGRRPEGKRPDDAGRPSDQSDGEHRQGAQSGSADEAAGPGIVGRRAAPRGRRSARLRVLLPLRRGLSPLPGALRRRLFPLRALPSRAAALLPLPEVLRGRGAGGEGWTFPRAMCPSRPTPLPRYSGERGEGRAADAPRKGNRISHSFDAEDDNAFVMGPFAGAGGLRFGRRRRSLVLPPVHRDGDAPTHRRRAGRAPPPRPARRRRRPAGPIGPDRRRAGGARPVVLHLGAFGPPRPCANRRPRRQGTVGHAPSHFPILHIYRRRRSRSPVSPLALRLLAP